jgi:hypothetical protein
MKESGYMSDISTSDTASGLGVLADMSLKEACDGNSTKRLDICMDNLLSGADTVVDSISGIGNEKLQKEFIKDFEKEVSLFVEKMKDFEQKMERICRAVDFLNQDKRVYSDFVENFMSE